MRPPYIMAGKVVDSAISFVYNSVKVEIAPHLTSSLSHDAVVKFPPFVSWVSRLQSSLQSSPVRGGYGSTDPPSYYELKKINITSADFFGSKKDKLGFLKLDALVENDKGNRLPGIVFLRGQSVSILVLLYPSEQPDTDNLEDLDDSQAQVVLVVQPRVPGATMAMVEIPAGMYDANDASSSEGGTLKYTAQRELKEECGIEITPKELRPLYTTNGGIYMSAGACDEQMQFFVCKKVLSVEEIQMLEGKFGGAEEETGERITVRILPFSELLTATQDSKTLCALALYAGAKRHNK
ncbi:uncharacterized protein V1518DRAFT_409284 [Limtongia smithiae]|uniref:uncharacterized protein n=1 Tax=Limtongia smithiae TaxID=1125753 RepID=UPI0034CF7B06